MPWSWLLSCDRFLKYNTVEVLRMVIKQRKILRHTSSHLQVGISSNLNMEQKVVHQNHTT